MDCVCRCEPFSAIVLSFRAASRTKNLSSGHLKVDIQFQLQTSMTSMRRSELQIIRRMRIRLLFSFLDKKLERVPQPDLHDPPLPLDLDEVGPVIRRLGASPCRIANYTKPSAANVNEAEMLRVRDVEHIPTKLQLVTFAPRHLPRFPQPEIDINVPG